MSFVNETDYGTPASKAEKTVTLSVDGKKVTVPEGTSIMRAAMDAGIEIPKLCATDMLESFGSCRVCLVEIEGRGGTPLLEGCCAVLECRNEIQHAGGDHLIFIGRIESCSRMDKAPLVFHGGRYRILGDG